MAILSDYKLTGEYADQLKKAGLTVERRWGNPLYTFPPLRIVVARKTLGSNRPAWMIRSLSPSMTLQTGKSLFSEGDALKSLREHSA